VMFSQIKHGIVTGKDINFGWADFHKTEEYIAIMATRRHNCKSKRELGWRNNGESGGRAI